MARVGIAVKYRLLRDVHLAIGAFLTPYLLIYAVSALQMAHPVLTFGKPAERTWEATIAPGATDPLAVRETLRASHDVRGELRTSRIEGGVVHLGVERPGRRYEIEVDTETGRVRAKEVVSTASRLLNRLHHARGLWNREPVANAWGGAVALVSAGLLGLLVSGVWLWLERPKERRAGLLFLGTSVTFALALLASMRLA